MGYFKIVLEAAIVMMLGMTTAAHTTSRSSSSSTSSGTKKLPCIPQDDPDNAALDPVSNFRQLTELILGNQCFHIFDGEQLVCRQLLGYPVILNNAEFDFGTLFCCPESLIDIDALVLDVNDETGNVTCTQVVDVPPFACFGPPAALGPSPLIPSGVGAAITFEIADELEFTKEVEDGIKTLCCDSGGSAEEATADPSLPLP